MKALVTGGAGFIGSSVVRVLLENNIEVKVIDNLSTGYIENINGLEVEFLNADILDLEKVKKVSKGVDYIFHLAAHIGNIKSLQNPQLDSQVNVLGTINLLEAAKINNVKKIIYSSSAAIFGELLTPTIDESHPQNPTSPYGISKLSAEKQVLCFGKLYNFETVCLRYFNVYGIHQRYDAYGNVIPIFANCIYSKKPITIFGDGNQTRDFINSHDVAMINYRTAINDVNGVFNVGKGESITINELARLVQEASGISIKIEYANSRLGEVIHCKADINRIKNIINYTPQIGIKNGLKEYFDWYSNNIKKDV